MTARYDATHPTTFGLGLHHVQLSAPPGTEDESRRFWVDTLGFRELQKPPDLAARGGIWIRADQLEIHIGVEEEFVAARKAHPGILVGDLDAFATHLTSRGVEVTWDDKFPGFRRCYTKDNNGNRLEFLQPRTDVPALW